jgi:O-antigen/teichoic acid export membrane protein
VNEGEIEDGTFANRVRSAVFWRSGSQIASQMVMWGSTLAVIRILDPRDYGLFAMTQVILALLNFLNGYGFASSIIQSDSVDTHRIRQAFGMLLLLNGGLAILQLTLAPVVADYYNQPMVADLMRVQALLYLATPFIALPDVLLSRALDFRNQAKANFASAIVGAGTALACALAGWGVWTLVAAPIALFYTRAIALNLAARVLVWPSFDFRGAGAMFGYGGAILVTQLFWIVQSQSDIFIGGRTLDPHALGIYAEALFLTQIVATKFVPPLNDVAFPAYSRLQHDRAAFSSAFVKAVKLIMLATMPIYFGLAATAEPLVVALFGEKWIEMVPLVRILALAMPFVTLQILYSPATNGVGKPWIAARSSIAGAMIMIVAFLIGVRHGGTGLALAWLIGFPAFALVASAMSLPAIGVSWQRLGLAIAPALLVSATMAGLVWSLDQILPPLGPFMRLALLVPAGAAAYGALLFLFARATLDELLRLVIRRKPIEA